MGLFARLLQPTLAAGKYCLPYGGQNALVRQVLSTTTNFVGELPTRVTREQRYLAAMAILVASMHSLTDVFERHGMSDAIDCTPASHELAGIAEGLGLNFETMYWHDDERNYVRSALAAFPTAVVAKLGDKGKAIVLMEHRKTVFRAVLEQQGRSPHSLEYNNSVLNFVLQCMMDPSDDYMLTMRLESMLSGHLLGVGVLPSQMGRERPIKI